MNSCNLSKFRTEIPFKASKSSSFCAETLASNRLRLLSEARCHSRRADSLGLLFSKNLFLLHRLLEMSLFHSSCAWQGRRQPLIERWRAGTSSRKAGFWLGCDLFRAAQVRKQCQAEKSYFGCREAAPLLHLATFESKELVVAFGSESVSASGPSGSQ